MIAALSLFLAYSHTPLIGSWEAESFMYEGNAAKQDISEEERIAHREEIFSRLFEFHPNGTGTLNSLERGIYEFNWTTEGNRLIIEGSLGTEIYNFRVHRFFFGENAIRGSVLELSQDEVYSSRVYGFSRFETLSRLRTRGR